MPARYIRTDWLDSDKIRRAGELPEVLFLRMALGLADDYGRGDRRISVIQRACWPVEEEDGGVPPPTREDIAARLAVLIREGLIVPYEVGGKPYFWIPNFRQRTRSQCGSKFPDPPAPPTVDPQANPQETHKPGQMTDTPPTTAGQVPAHWRAADGAPQARSRSSTRTLEGNDGHRADKPPSKGKPMLPAKQVTETQRLIEESRKAAANAVPPPTGSAMELLKRAAAAKGNGSTTPPEPPPREPGQDDEERAIGSLDEIEGINDLDREAEALGMKRMAFENDEALQTRINARRALG